MNQTRIRKYILMITLILFSINAEAYDFEVDDIYYNIISSGNNEVEVTHGNTYSSGDVVIPEYVTFNQKTYKITGIGDRAFDGGHVHSLTIPSTVIKLSDTFVCPFPNNLNILLAFYVDDNNPYFTSFDGVLYSKDMSELIRFPYKKSGDFEVPKSVKKIKKLAFQDCGSITSIKSESVEIIESRAFGWCYNLKSATFGESLSEMGDSVFFYSQNLEKVELPNTLTHIKSYTFYECNKLSDIRLPQILLTIGNRAFMKCESIASITIPNSVTNIDNYAFARCDGLTSIMIPKNVINIGARAFACYGLNTIIVSSENTKYDSRNTCNAII